MDGRQAKASLAMAAATAAACGYASVAFAAC